jgi:hypothetical protein
MLRMSRASSMEPMTAVVVMAVMVASSQLALARRVATGYITAVLVS